MNIVDELYSKSHSYRRHGGKKNRAQQVGRMVTIVKWIGENHPNVRHLDQIGKRHVIGFWRAHRGMPKSTAYGYWLALCVIWRDMIGRPADPPKPRQMDKPEKIGATTENSGPGNTTIQPEHHHSG